MVVLIVTIELHSAVTGEITTIATGKIVNTGAGTATQGNYRVDLGMPVAVRGRPERLRDSLESAFWRGIYWPVRFIPSWEIAMA